MKTRTKRITDLQFILMVTACSYTALNYALFYNSKTPIINSDVPKQKAIMLKRGRRLLLLKF